MIISVFIPRYPGCAVYAAHSMLGANAQDVFVDQPYPHINSVYNRHISLFTPATRKLFFGHGCPDGTAIYSLHGNLPLAWWETELKQYDLAYFHACYGARFFSAKGLRNKYGNWIAFDNELSMLQGNQRIENIWKDIFKDTTIAIRTAADIEELKNRLVEIYENAILYADDMLVSPLSDITITHLEKTLDTLRTNKD